MNTSTTNQSPFAASAGVAAVSSYCLLRATGNDRVKFLNGLVTNDVSRLGLGDGCELFLTTVQGKTLGFGWGFARPDSLLLELAARDAADILRHFDKYTIREDVKFEDITAEHQVLVVAGPKAAERLSEHVRFAPEQTEVALQTVELGKVPVDALRLISDPLLVHLVCPRDETAQVLGALHDLGIQETTAEDAEALRIEYAVPSAPGEISTNHLPQELDRDARAISFNKGCYLGQETVARLDALGHVNWLLRRLHLPTAKPLPPGMQLELDGKPIARITSSAYSPRLGRAVALAYVRSGYEQPGQKIPTPEGEGDVR